MSRRRERSAKQPGAPDPPRGPGPPYTVRTPQRGGKQTLRLRGSGAATCPQAQARARPRSFPGKTRPPTAFNAGDVSALCHSRARGDFCQAVLLIARYQGAQCSRMRRIRAEPVCRIKWIQRHGTFPSYRLRRKLHGPFSYAAGDAPSYAWRRFDKTVHGYAGRRILAGRQGSPGMRSPSPAMP